MKRLITMAMLGAAVSAVQAAETLSAAVDRIPLRDGWRFFRAALSTDEHDFTFDRMSAWLDGKNAPARMPGKNHHCVKPDCDDSLWREVTVPHDWGIERTFDAMQNDIYEANLDMTGVGWYRMKFNVEGTKLAVGGKQAEVSPGGKVYFACDGAASFAMVWINGRFVGGWPYQYTSWRVDLTPHLKDGENVLAVRTEQYSAANRWYGGAGLYRECCLEVCPRDHLVADSVFITTPVVEKDRAVVRVQYEMSESGRKEYSFEVKNPRLWDIDDPHLYELSLEGETFRYGIREFSCHADERGFQLNGRRVQLRGMCLHQDLGALGNVWNRAAWRRRLLQLKEAGVNAIRMSHYRHASGFYDLCDEMGFLVLDEVFDAWERGFCENDYHRLFPVWAERDLRSWVRSTRNHPSVVLRSVGNEISEQRPDFGESDMPRFETLGRKLKYWTLEEDPTRPVTTANNGADSWNAPEAQWVDVYGFNYHPEQIADYHREHPDKPTFTTESGCIIATRGEYFLEPKGWTMVDFHTSAYGDVRICSVEKEFEAWEATPSHMGGFFWTGFDYLGGPCLMWNVREKVSASTPEIAAQQQSDLENFGIVKGGSHTCETGLFDTAGFPRDTFWLFQAKWRPDIPVVHMLPHWNWEGNEGTNVPVVVYSNGDEVELFVNGKTHGRRRPEAGGVRFSWRDVLYAQGSIRAVAYRKGRVWAEKTVETTGCPSRLVAEPEMTRIPADGSEFGVVTVKVVDDKGRVVPNACVPVKIEVSGAGSFHAADNGDGADMTWYRRPERNTFNGCLSVLVKPAPGKAGKVKAVVRSEGLETAVAEISCDK